MSAEKSEGEAVFPNGKSCRVFKPETEIWVDVHVPNWGSLTDPPKKLPGGSSYKLQTADHMKFCERLTINTLEGSLGLLYEQWEFESKSHYSLLELFRLVLAPQAQETVKAVIGSTKILPKLKVVVEGSQGRGGFLGQYMFKVSTRPTAALALVTQLLGSL